MQYEKLSSTYDEHMIKNREKIIVASGKSSLTHMGRKNGKLLTATE
jgi:hypothetical protein